MKRSLILPLLAGALLAVSCNTDNTLYYNITEMGNVRDGKIISDSGMTYTIVENPEAYDITGLDRVLFLADVLVGGDTEKAYDIRLKSLFKVPSPDIVKAADFVEPTEESADRAVRINTAWFGGGYLNLELNYLVQSDSKVEHDFSIAEQIVPEGKDTLFLRLFHNAGAEDEHWDGSTTLSASGLTVANAYYSFPVSEFAPADGSTRPIKLIYRWHSYNVDEYLPETELYQMKGEFTK